MKGEIRGLKAGMYEITDGAVVNISRCDGGTIISLADFDIDVAYTIVIDENGKVEFGDVQLASQALLEDMDD